MDLVNQSNQSNIRQILMNQENREEQCKIVNQPKQLISDGYNEPTTLSKP
jgi:hypothetical protein